MTNEERLAALYDQVVLHQKQFRTQPAAIFITSSVKRELERGDGSAADYHRLRNAGYNGRALFGLPLVTIDHGIGAPK
jgi:hypothetical protein